MPKCTLIGHVGTQPPTTDSRSNPSPEGFEPLTKGSRSNPPTNCTLWLAARPWIGWRNIDVAGQGGNECQQLIIYYLIIRTSSTCSDYYSLEKNCIITPTTCALSLVAILPDSWLIVVMAATFYFVVCIGIVLSKERSKD
jgi:hypothetical protein